MKTKFEIQCEKIADEQDVSVAFFPSIQQRDPHDDDGCLIITKGKIFAAFGIGQDEKVSIYNEKTKAILKALSLEKFIGPRTLAADECPHGCDEQGCQGECSCQECGETHACCTCENEEEE